MKVKLFFAVFAALGLVACGGKSHENTVDSDSLALEEMVGAVEAVQSSTGITRDSIGAVHIGMPVNELQDSVSGLYRSKTLGSSPDAVTTLFFDEDGESFVAYDFGEGNVDVLSVSGRNVKVMAPRGEFGLGDTFEKVLELPGVKAEWSGYDDNGQWYWTWEGLWFAPTADVMPETLGQRLFHSGTAPTYKDFTPEVKVGYIGTGLPF